MKSAEIRKSLDVLGLDPKKNCYVAQDQFFWLGEIAYQLAVMNERNAAGDSAGVNRMLEKVGLKEPPATAWQELLTEAKAACYERRDVDFSRLHAAIQNCEGLS